MSKPLRYSLRENVVARGLIDRIAADTVLPARRIQLALDTAGQSVGSALNTESTGYLRSEGNGVIASGIAGMLRLLPGVELAISPKFLAKDSATWHQDFAAALSLSISGRILPQRPIQSDFGTDADFTRLMAAEWLASYRHTRRSPLRSYTREPSRSFDISADTDWPQLGQLNDNGFLQSGLRLSKNNQFNAAMAQAAAVLATRIADPTIRQSLETASRDLVSPQPVRSIHKNFPSRALPFKPLYELSLNILEGKSPQFGNGRFQAPGYIFRTWPLWESLCEHALRSPLWDTTRQSTVALGVRNAAVLNVRPDIQLTTSTNRAVVVDAKYKRREESGKNITSPADVYEALAFLTATKSTLAILLYPDTSSTVNGNSLGLIRQVEAISIGNRRIIAAALTTHGLAQADGLSIFGATAQRGISQLIAENP